ncbi:PaaI family thioesterase [Rhizobium sp. MC63]|uniref:PaaI family thioesterase n=1 Tax=Rhizobium mulingense TaxID=3031128 RepID=A0ACC6N2T1_9HYPH|nr:MULTISPECIES: PaaI family thioesterase [unclassified Rhizobium]MDF0699433.1 PaaI family thioesterase [Rhizobium sp. MC63]MEA3519750.1 PaaI family thioesterase [Rhizobium sp. MJ31]
MGSVHGGYAATLLDSACGCAVNSSLPAGQGYTTLELKVAYHRALNESSGQVRAEGKIVSPGRRVAFSEARLRAGPNWCASKTSARCVGRLAVGGPGHCGEVGRKRLHVVVGKILRDPAHEVVGAFFIAIFLQSYQQEDSCWPAMIGVFLIVGRPFLL